MSQYMELQSETILDLSAFNRLFGECQQRFIRFAGTGCIGRPPLGGKARNKYRVGHDELVRGGRLVFDLQANPNKQYTR